MFTPFVDNPIDDAAVRQMDALALAYVGDAVQSLYVRTREASANPAGAGELHHRSVKKVCAEAQAKVVDHVRALFSTEEDEVYRMARNHKTKSSAKNASVASYHKATGIEAVWGYLYLTGQNARLEQLLALAYSEE